MSPTEKKALAAGIGTTLLNLAMRLTDYRNDVLAGVLVVLSVMFIGYAAKLHWWPLKHGQRNNDSPLTMEVNCTGVNSQAWYEYHVKEESTWYISASFLIRFVNADHSQIQIHGVNLDLVTKRWLIFNKVFKTESLARYFSVGNTSGTRVKVRFDEHDLIIPPSSSGEHRFDFRIAIDDLADISNCWLRLTMNAMRQRDVSQDFTVNWFSKDPETLINIKPK